MAVFNLAVTYPDAQQARILTALKAHWTTKDAQGVDVVPTTQQVVEKLRLVVVANIKDIVFTQERDAAVKAAAAGIVVVDAT
jgi:hypothetical protein